MQRMLTQCLADLERRINPEQEDELLRQWTSFTEDGFQGDLFSPRRNRAAPPRVEWPRVPVNAALEDYDLMALQQYGKCSQRLADGSGLLLDVRANYGTAIVPSLFGVELFIMDEALDTLPTSRPLNDLDALRRLIERGVPGLHQGYGPRVLAMAERYLAIGQEYPKVGRYVHIFHPDLQGPMDICELLAGSSLFYWLYDHPDLIKALLELVTETYARFLRAWMALVPFRSGGNSHWGLYHRGNIMLRDDSAMNLSPAMFDEFVRPYDQRLLHEFGGGAIHFCGKGDHYVASLAQMEGLYALNLSQPEYNDMEVIYRHTVDRGIKIIGLKREVAEEAIARGRDLHGQVHCH